MTMWTYIILHETTQAALCTDLGTYSTYAQFEVLGFGFDGVNYYALCRYAT
jgi:hypothetical protein